MDARSQNLLLKAIEEPPSYGYFLFTATAPTALLPTIRSRILSLAVTPVSEPECMEALEERGISATEATEAVEAFHGNIGMCLQFLEKDEIRGVVGLTKSAINSIISKNEYELLRVMAEAGENRERAQFFLVLLDRTIRDAMVLRQNPEAGCIGCDKEGAAALSMRLSATAGQQIHLAIGTTYGAVKANVNLPLALSALCTTCMDAG
jgi:DNA polymerase-3 subunit delta'